MNKKLQAIIFTTVLMASILTPLFVTAGPSEDGWNYITFLGSVSGNGGSGVVSFSANNLFCAICNDTGNGAYNTVDIYWTSNWTKKCNLSDFNSNAMNVMFDDSNHWLAVGLGNGSGYIYYQGNFSMASNGDLLDIGTRITNIDFSEDDMFVVFGGRGASHPTYMAYNNPTGNGTITNWHDSTKIWEVNNGGSNDDFGGEYVLSQGGEFLLGCRNGMFVWNTSTRENVSGSPFDGANAKGGTFSHDGKWMVHGYSDNGTVEIYGQLNQTYCGNLSIPVAKSSWKHQFSRDGRFMAVEYINATDDDNEIAIYNVGTWDNSTWTLNTTFYNATELIRDMGFDIDSEVFVFGHLIDVGQGRGAWVYQLPAAPAGEPDTSHPCNSTGYLYGNWTKSEHAKDGDYEEDLTFYNESCWNVTDHSSWWAGNYTLQINTANMSIPVEYAVFNESGTNRSQGFGWVHDNETEGLDIVPFVIFSYHNATDFDCVAWDNLQTYILHWNGTNMTDFATGDLVEVPSVDATDYTTSRQFEDNVYINREGFYWKYLYNAINGSLKFKYWGENGFMSEPVSWQLEIEHLNITETNCRCHGFGIMNPTNISTYVQFDLVNVWQLNYSLNQTTWCNINDINTSRPHMDFPVIDLSEWTEEIMSYFNATAAGNLSIDTIRDVMKNNITNPMNMESRLMQIKTLDSGQQNDTVYYYSCVIDNFTAFSESSYDEWLHLQVQMCPEDDIETGEYAYFIVGIDVDNNRLWDANDRIYVSYTDDTYDVTYWTLNGNGNPIADLSSWSVWKSGQAVPGNLHRYNSHLNFAISIPFADLIKTGGIQLNSSDVFGLSIATTTSGVTYTTQDACVWQNWNETNEAIYYTEEDNWLNVEEYFFNCTGEGGYLPNVSTLKRWGEGQIGTGLSSSGEIFYNATIEKVANISYTEPGSTYARINYTIWVNNTGSGTLTELVVNDTKFNCTCHDFNETDFIYTNVPWANVTNYSCTRIFTHDSLAQGASWQIIYSVNISNCSGVTTGTIQNNASLNATQLDNALEDNVQISWGSINRLCVSYTSDLVDVQATGNTVFTIIGIVFIIGAILLIIGIVGKYGSLW